MSNMIQAGTIVSTKRTVLININIEIDGETLAVLLENVVRSHGSQVSNKVQLQVRNSSNQFLVNKLFSDASTAQAYFQENYQS